jgi:LacI family transcriptional regulator
MMLSRVTIDDVARAAGVSKATVSRVLNGRADVSTETADRVSRAASELNFVKNRRAVQLASGRSESVGVIAPSGTDDWMIEVLRGAMQQAQAHHLDIVLLTAPQESGETDRLVSSLRGRAFDGVLVVQPREKLEWLGDLQREGLPVAVLDDHGTNRDVDAFVPDERVGIDQAVDHLVALGRRDVALLSGPSEERTLYTTTKRLEFYREAFGRHGIRLDDDMVVPTQYSLAGGKEGVDELLRRGRKFNALVASSDAMAVGAMRGLKQAGLVVPRAVSVIGFDDFPSANYTDPTLSTVHNPLFEMSVRAIERLVGKDRTDRKVVRQVVPTHFIARDSTGPLVVQREEK